MSDEVTPPESLLKKKCQCDEQLKRFAYSAVHMVPEWFGQGVAQLAVDENVIPIIPDIATHRSIMLITFTSVCENCGSVTQWMLSKEEFEFIISERGKKLGYGTMWFYNPEFIEEAFKNFPYSLIEPIIEAAKVAENHRTEGNNDKSK